jgi:hypothetical protein
VPANALVLECDLPILGPERPGAESDELVPGRAAGEQLPVELGPEALRLDGAGKRRVVLLGCDRATLLRLGA